MKTNRRNPANAIRTHEGGIAKRIDAEKQLRRSVCACMLWEDTFYEDGTSIAERIAELVARVSPEFAADLALEARTKMKLRHAPLWIVRAMAALPSHRHLVGGTLPLVIQRADELTEFLSLYWLNGKAPLGAQVKKGLARAFENFNEYQFAKYARENSSGVKFRDVLRMCHPHPKNDEQAALWGKIVKSVPLQIPDTWEVALSTGQDKKETWERLMTEKKLGGLALLRNLRNMEKVSVNRGLIEQAIAEMRTERILPFRFIKAAKYAPSLESSLEAAMLKCLEQQERISGTTVLLIDVSGSMSGSISGKSDLQRSEAAAALAILCREKCENVFVYTFSNHLATVPPRRGFALSDAIEKSQTPGGTYLSKALSGIREKYDRIIIFTDEQSHDGIRNPLPGSKAYVINVASYKNGVGYGKWHHIDGFSEACVDYVLEYERITAVSEPSQETSTEPMGDIDGRLAQQD